MARYCTTCRKNFHGDTPPHAARHVSEDEHIDPATGEQLEEIVPVPVGDGVVVLRHGALAGQFTNETQLDAYLKQAEDPVVVVPRADWVASVAERVAS